MGEGGGARIEYPKPKSAVIGLPLITEYRFLPLYDLARMEVGSNLALHVIILGSQMEVKKKHPKHAR